jgi:hypothetical protein
MKSPKQALLSSAGALEMVHIPCERTELKVFDNVFSDYIRMKHVLYMYSTGKAEGPAAAEGAGGTAVAGAAAGTAIGAANGRAAPCRGARRATGRVAALGAAD